MLKQLTTVTATLSLLLTPFPVQSQVNDQELENRLGYLAQQSSEVYCTSKDRGISEEKSLKNAFVFFLKGIQEDTRASWQEVIILTENQKFIDYYESLFNQYALQNCPEYY